MGAGHFNRKFIKSSLKTTIGKGWRNNFKNCLHGTDCIYESTTDNLLWSQTSSKHRNTS